MTALGSSHHSRYPGVSGSPRERTFGQCVFRTDPPADLDDLAIIPHDDFIEAVEPSLDVIVHVRTGRRQQVTRDGERPSAPGTGVDQWLLQNE
jgi:hypothetical protein